MKKSEEYLNDCPSGATTKGLFKGSEVIEAINQARRDAIDECAKYADVTFTTDPLQLNYIRINGLTICVDKNSILKLKDSIQ